MKKEDLEQHFSKQRNHALDRLRSTFTTTLRGLLIKVAPVNEAEEAEVANIQAIAEQMTAAIGEDTPWVIRNLVNEKSQRLAVIDKLIHQLIDHVLYDRSSLQYARKVWDTHFDVTLLDQVLADTSVQAIMAKAGAINRDFQLIMKLIRSATSADQAAKQLAAYGLYEILEETRNDHLPVSSEALSLSWVSSSKEE